MAKQIYSGCAFYPSLGDEVVVGTISFTAESLCFFSDQGKIEIPLSRLKLRIDVATRRIFFSDAQHSKGNVFTDEFDVLDHRAFTQNPELRAEIARLTGVKNQGLRLIVASAIFFAIFMLFALGFFWAGGLTLRFLVNKVPTTYESDIGDKIVGELKERNLLADDPKAIASLQALGKQLLPKEARNKFKFEFHIVPMPEPNAFAVPGGKIFVTEGALQLLNREDLAGVLSHEITHVVKRHALRQIISTLGTFAALKLLVHGDSAFQSAVGEASELLFSSGYSQSLENEADDGGWKYLVAANIDPRSLPNALRKLEADHVRGAGSSETGANAPSKLFRTHPLTSERLKRFDKKWSELKNKSGFIDLGGNGSEKVLQ